MGQLRAANPHWNRETIDYDVSLRALIGDSSEVVKAFAMYHEGEISIDESGSMGRALGVIEHLPDSLGNRPAPALAGAGN